MQHDCFVEPLCVSWITVKQIVFHLLVIDPINSWNLTQDPPQCRSACEQTWRGRPSAVTSPWQPWWSHSFPPPTDPSPAVGPGLLPGGGGGEWGGKTSVVNVYMTSDTISGTSFFLYFLLHPPPPFANLHSYHFKCPCLVIVLKLFYHRKSPGWLTSSPPPPTHGKVNGKIMLTRIFSFFYGKSIMQ